MAHIKKVEIFGFKSFGFKTTTVNFQPGLTSISGSNGSGKSNILEAIIFALGENNPRLMRKPRLALLLHDDGGSGRKRGSMVARCSVYFDNSDRRIPIDSDKVKITREMDGKGQSAYYLNDRKVPRGHVLNLLETANASLGPLNVVQQGTAQRISEYSDQEMRKLIEDLAGLASFDAKKEEAEKQLDAADRTLAVALAKTDDVKKRVDELEEERNLKLRYDMLDAEIHMLEAASAANEMVEVRRQLGEKEKERGRIADDVRRLSEERGTVRKEAEELDAEKKDVMERASAYQEAKTEIDRRIGDSVALHEKAKAELEAALTRISKARQRLPEIDRTAAEIGRLAETGKEERRALLASISDRRKTKDECDRQILSLDEERTLVLKEQELLDAKTADLGAKAAFMRERAASALMVLSKTQSDIRDAEARLDSNCKSRSSVKEQLTLYASGRKKLDALVASCSSEMKRARSEIAALTSRREKISRSMEGIGPIVEKADLAAARFGAKIKTIRSIMHEDYSVSKLKENADRLGIAGLAYEVMSWSREHERAALAAGSDWLKAVLVRDFDTLLSLSEHARINNLPRVKMLAYGGEAPSRLREAQGDGVLGSLSDFVHCDPKYAAVREFLFGNTALVRTRGAARAVSREGMRAVTLDGELFEPHAAAVVMDTRSKIAKLTRAISMSGSVDDLTRAVALLKRYLGGRRSAIGKIDAAIAEARDRVAAAEKRMAAASQLRDIDSAGVSSRKMAALDARIAELRQKREILRIRSVCQTSAVESLNWRAAAMDDRHSLAARNGSTVRLSALNRRGSDLDAKRAEIAAAAGADTSRLAALEARMKGAEERLSALEEEREALESEIRSLQENSERLTRQKAEYGAALVALREKEQDLFSKSGNSVGQLAKYDDELKSLNDRDRRITTEINSLERRSDSISGSIASLERRADELHKLAGGAEPRKDADAIEHLLSILRTEQKGLPPLNAKAPESYLTVTGLYRSMSDRKNELEKDRAAIVGFIAEVERDKRQTFLSTFDLANREIREAFSKMTGGNAWLELQDEDDIFASGVSYMVQFPNKPKYESASMSGGEKALAAAALLLALQRLNPSPFYLFDEADANLDQANAALFSKFLGERAKESQFIIVSLKDSVVMTASLIYGVYPKNGISQIVVYKDPRLPQAEV